MASGRGGGGTRRAGRARARALGRSGAGARRARRGGGVPAARGRADRRPRRGAPRRALAAAEASLQAGAFDVARRTAGERRRSGPLDELQRARLDLLRAEAAYSESRGSEAPALLLRAAQTLEPLDPQLARETYLDAWSSALFAGRLRGHPRACTTSRAKPGRLGGPAGRSARASDLLLDGFCAGVHRRPRRGGAGPRAARRAASRASDVSIEEVLRWGWLATAAAVMVWDYETCVAVATRGVELAREAGALTVLAVSVNVMAQAVALGGEFGNGGAAGRRGRQRHRGHGHPSRALRRPRARRPSGPRGRGRRS